MKNVSAKNNARLSWHDSFDRFAPAAAKGDVALSKTGRHSAFSSSTVYGSQYEKTRYITYRRPATLRCSNRSCLHLGFRENSLLVLVRAVHFSSGVAFET